MGELARLPRRGCYYVFSDLPTLYAGNIDHLVVGPEGLTVIETKANRGTIEAHRSPDGGLTVTVGGKPLHRDVMWQVRAQLADLCERAGMRGGPESTTGFSWLVCFPAGELGPRIPPKVRAHLTTLTELLMKVPASETKLETNEVRSVARAISKLYGKSPDVRPDSDH